MRKSQIAIGIVVALAAFAAADFYLNDLGKDVSLDPGNSAPVSATQADQPAPILSAFKVGDQSGGFKVVGQAVTTQVFDKVDLGAVKNIRVVKTQMEKALAAPAPVPVDANTPVPSAPAIADAEPLTVYEVQGPKDQGTLTYLAVKLQFVAQINATTETINEDGKFGENSFFYNDQNLANTAFLLTQIGDNLYGFRYNKMSPSTYDSIQKIIQGLTPKP
jgi:hypothetical protein